MNQQEVIARLIEQLKLAVSRPALFAGKATVDAVGSFLNGMSLACFATGIVISLDIRREATKSRGWKFYANTALYLRDQGLSEEQIVQELLRIEIKMLEIVAEGLMD